MKLFNSNLDVVDDAFEYLINKSSRLENINNVVGPAGRLYKTSLLLMPLGQSSQRPPLDKS
jgi:hypothetical protein